MHNAAIRSHRYNRGRSSQWSMGNKYYKDGLGSRVHHPECILGTSAGGQCREVTSFRSSAVVLHIRVGDYKATASMTRAVVTQRDPRARNLIGEKCIPLHALTAPHLIWKLSAKRNIANRALSHTRRDAIPQYLAAPKRPGCTCSKASRAVESFNRVMGQGVHWQHIGRADQSERSSAKGLLRFWPCVSKQAAPSPYM